MQRVVLLLGVGLYAEAAHDAPSVFAWARPSEQCLIQVQHRSTAHEVSNRSASGLPLPSNPLLGIATELDKRFGRIIGNYIKFYEVANPSSDACDESLGGVCEGWETVCAEVSELTSDVCKKEKYEQRCDQWEDVYQSECEKIWGVFGFVCEWSSKFVGVACKAPFWVKTGTCEVWEQVTTTVCQLSEDACKDFFCFVDWKYVGQQLRPPGFVRQAAERGVGAFQDGLRVLTGGALQGPVADPRRAAEFEAWKMMMAASASRALAGAAGSGVFKISTNKLVEAMKAAVSRATPPEEMVKVACQAWTIVAGRACDEGGWALSFGVSASTTMNEVSLGLQIGFAVGADKSGARKSGWFFEILSPGSFETDAGCGANFNVGWWDDIDSIEGVAVDLAVTVDLGLLEDKVPNEFRKIFQNVPTMTLSGVFVAEPTSACAKGGWLMLQAEDADCHRLRRGTANAVVASKAISIAGCASASPLSGSLGASSTYTTWGTLSNYRSSLAQVASAEAVVLQARAVQRTATQRSEFWSLESGACQVAGNCISSAGFPGYRRSTCRFKALQSLTVSATSWGRLSTCIRSRWFKSSVLSIEGVQSYGASTSKLPIGVAVPAGQWFSWHPCISSRRYSRNDDVWRLCLEEPALGTYQKRHANLLPRRLTPAASNLLVGVTGSRRSYNSGNKKGAVTAAKEEWCARGCDADPSCTAFFVTTDPQSPEEGYCNLYASWSSADGADSTGRKGWFYSRVVYQVESSGGPRVYSLLFQDKQYENCQCQNHCEREKVKNPAAFCARLCNSVPECRAFESFLNGQCCLRSAWKREGQFVTNNEPGFFYSQLPAPEALACTGWPTNRGSMQQKCENGNMLGDGWHYVYNRGRGTASAACGQHSACWCCKKALPEYDQAVSLQTSFLGCGRQAGWRRPYGNVELSQGGAAECLTKCYRDGYSFAGLECPMGRGHGGQVHCQCGSSANIDSGRQKCTRRHPDRHCNGHKIIGGYHMGLYGVGSVYSTTYLAGGTTRRFLGCKYKVGQWTRPYGQVALTTQGVHRCFALCKKGGYAFAGLECPTARGVVDCQCANKVSINAGITSCEIKEPDRGCNGPKVVDGIHTGGWAVGSVYSTF